MKSNPAPGEVSTNPWLVLLHQLPPKPAYVRVKVWRRLQAQGAIPIKNSVYVLPNTDEAREDFEWMLREIVKDGGEASFHEARLVDGLSDDQVRASFLAAREADYRELAESIRTAAKGVRARRNGRGTSRDADLEAAITRYRRRLVEIEKVDFFGAPGRESAEGLLRQIEQRGAAGTAPVRTQTHSRMIRDVQRRTWVTRKGVHIDRMASAWLIRRFIDQDSTFKFVVNRGYQPEPGELRFDMFEAEFTHDGDLCTFEVLLREFALQDAALSAIAEIVHDIDLKEAKFGRPEGPGIDHIITGIARTQSDDPARIAQATPVFDALYSFFQRSRR